MTTFTIEKTTEFGVVVNGGKYYSVYDKSNPPASLKPGMTIKAELVESKKKPGTIYISKLMVVSQEAEAPKAEVKPSIPQPENPVPAPVQPKAKKQETAEKVDWDAIALGKVRCAAATAALQSPMLMAAPNAEKATELAEVLSNWVVEYTFRKAE